MENRKLLFVTEFAGFKGGIEQYVYESAKLLADNGFELTLLYERPEAEFERFTEVFNSVANRLEALSDIDYSLVVVHKIRDLELLNNMLQTFPDKLCAIIHDHELYCPRRHYYRPWKRTNCHRRYNYLVCGVCGMLSSPLGFENGLSGELQEKFYDFPRRMKLFRRIKKFIVLSKFMRNNLVKNNFDPSKIVILSPFVKGAPSEKKGGGAVPKIGFAGQLIAGKGADRFLQCLSRLQMPFTAEIAGNGKDLHALKIQAEQLKLPVEFAGYVEDMEPFYQSCDLMILPFRWQEPFGLVGAESARCGVPVVAFDNGGVRSWLKPNITGFIAAPDNIEDLAQGANRLIQDEQLRSRMGCSAANFAAEKFSPEQFLRGFNAIITEFEND